MTRTRLTAAERGEQLVDAAVRAFARAGYAGTSTDDVARLAGVSQPYVIRLFGSKQRLFIAAVEHATGRIEQIFQDAASERADLETLGDGYDRLLAEPDLLAILMHGFAASADPEIGARVRDRFGRIYTLIRELTGADARQTRDFLAAGMLITVLGAMRVTGPEAVTPDTWMVELLGTFDSSGARPGKRGR